MEYGYMFNKSDYAILELLIAGECFSPFKSLTKQHLIKETGYSHVKVQQSLKGFMLANFVKEGTKDRNNKTYFCTEEGKLHYMKIFAYTEEDIEELIEDKYQEEINKNK